MIAKLALDTNAYRALADGNTQLAGHVKAAPHIALPLPVLGELYYGIYAGSKHADNLAALNRFLAAPRIEVLYSDDATARIFGEIAVELRRAGRPIQQNDMWIAALCKQNGFALATADKDFDAVTGLELVRF